ncbi:MAG: hypothetical protein ACK5TM_16555, partial [Methylobacterium sp.]
MAGENSGARKEAEATRAAAAHAEIFPTAIIRIMPIDRFPGCFLDLEAILIHCTHGRFATNGLRIIHRRTKNARPLFWA